MTVFVSLRLGWYTVEYRISAGSDDPPVIRPFVLVTGWRPPDLLDVGLPNKVLLRLQRPCLASDTSTSDAAHITMPPLYNLASSTLSFSPKPSHLIQPQPLQSSQANSTLFTLLAAVNATFSLPKCCQNSPVTAQKSTQPSAGGKQPSTVQGS